MATQAANIIDLATYRRARVVEAPRPVTMPCVYVAWWAYVPVVFVPGYV